MSAAPLAVAYLGLAQLNRFLTGSRDHPFNIALGVSANTGMRRGEILGAPLGRR